MSGAPAARRSRRALIWAAGAALLLGAAVFAFWTTRACGCAPEPRHPPSSAPEAAAPRP
ncbi:hypothetical protein [Neomegalonema perideroedes]|uniref:hypothetical protein n=1 Tax=Neomegalonema perideroedes TaxID=217219 RepID=UPI00036A5DCB|nr:hypothetical protein [Neomegalonema perideroedes]